MGNVENSYSNVLSPPAVVHAVKNLHQHFFYVWNRPSTKFY